MKPSLATLHSMQLHTQHSLAGVDVDRPRQLGHRLLLTEANTGERRLAEHGARHKLVVRLLNQGGFVVCFVLCVVC